MKTILFTLLIFVSALNTFGQMEKSERYIRGWNKLQEIDGEAGEKVVNGLKDISPELSRFIIEYSFGDVYSLTVLNNKSKEVAAVASLITQGAIPQLKVHLNGALNSGCSVIEVKELILHCSVYVGFPKAINAMNALKEVLCERKNKGITDIEGIGINSNNNRGRYDIGAEQLAMLDSEQEHIMKQTYDSFSPELVQYIIEFGYGDIYSREGLDKRFRQIATIAALVTLGNAHPQLTFHIKAALNIGLTADEIKEVMLLMTIYTGFPAAINGMNVIKEIINDSCMYIN